jgi:hypothetical protein
VPAAGRSQVDGADHVRPMARVAARLGVVDPYVSDDRTGLRHFDVPRLEPEIERTIRQLPQAVMKVLVDRPGEDHLTVRNRTLHVTVVRVQQDLDVWMREHALEHPRVAVERHHLIGVGEVPIVAIGAHRNARRDARTEL